MVDAPATIDLVTEMAASRRSWFAWNLDEVSGALGDLGTFLPRWCTDSQEVERYLITFT
jgi:hypothetical protein